MDLGATLRTIIKRWYVFLPILFLGVGVSAITLQGMPSNYQANASMVIIAPPDQVVTTAGETVVANPYLQFGTSQQLMANILVTILSNDPLQQVLRADGVRGNWSLVVRGGFGPVLQLTVQDATADRALKSAQTILEVARSHLAEAQSLAGADNGHLLRLAMLDTPGIASPQVGSKLRVAAALGLVGLGLAVAAVSVVEGATRRRRPLEMDSERELVGAGLWE